MGEIKSEHIKFLRDKIGAELLNTFLSHWKDVIKAVEKEAKAGGMSRYTKYIFFLLFEHQKSWPSMPPRLDDALWKAKQILSESGNTPNYWAGLENVYGVEDGDKMADDVLKSLANWSNVELRKMLWKDYSTALKKYLPAYQKIMPEASYRTLDDFLNYYLEKFPHLFPRGSLLWSLLQMATGR